MNHLLILPILLPMFSGAVLLIAHRMGTPGKRLLSLLATWALVPVAVWLLLLAGDGQLRVYALGNWQPPFGIILLLDRLSALMLLLTALLGGFALLYASRGDDGRFDLTKAGDNGTLFKRQEQVSKWLGSKVFADYLEVA